MTTTPMGYMLFIVFLLCVSGVMPETDYNFEVGTMPSEISTDSSQSSLTLSTEKFKTGAKSLKWEWTTDKQLTWDLSSKNVGLTSNGGIKIWIYLSTKLPGKCLSVCVREKRSTDVSCFPMSLDFVGWRAVWVTYHEFIGCPSGASNRRSTANAFRGGKKIDQFVLKAPSGATSANPLYIDLLKFADKISKASRDAIVPPLTYDNDKTQVKCSTCVGMSPATLEKASLHYFPRSKYWQQKYRWSLKVSPQAATQVDNVKLSAIHDISRRLVNWYASESKTYTKIPHTVSKSDEFLLQRWNDLVINFNLAHTALNEFTTTAGSLPTSGLFVKKSEFGNSDVNGGAKKFAHFFYKVLHPLALEYHIKSRDIEVKHVACLFAKRNPCGQSISDTDIESITGTDSAAKSNFRTQYNKPVSSATPTIYPTCTGVPQVCFNHAVKAIRNLNDNRKTKIMNLFKYIKDQGWGSGSALGSMDHELLGMSGFAHSVFLMKDELKAAGKLDEMVEVMKWYMEFGEVYQTTFEFQGSSADRIRTVLLYRLMTVLIMPENNDRQKSEKVRDMKKFQLWVENALTINEGLADLIKPDFTVYHHRFFYATAYCPSALHTAALVSSLLDQTAYQLKTGIKQNLINAFKVYRIAAVYYSTPSQIGGRNPRYKQVILAEHVPAFAYLAMRSPFQRYHSPTYRYPNLNEELAEVRMFLRLYKPITTGTEICKSSVLNEQLCKGKIRRKYYLNTLGALEIMERVKELATSDRFSTREWFFEAEKSPSGHWTKEFASLTIHRRDDWAVTVKGFDKSVVDFESSLSPVGNLYGMYSSHGAMLIANSETALSSKNVDKGWDWRKIPGTTVISVPFSDMKIKSSHHYNPSPNAMAGGVAFKGNGVFGMDFKQPTYDVPSNSPFHEVDFRFKKSVFFYDDLIVSLGSKIRYDGGSHEVHTALFQDLMHQTPSPKLSQDNVYRCNDGGSLRKTTWQSKPSVTLVDVNGNRYYIPNPDNQGLVVVRDQKQSSVKHDMKTPVATEGKYCTAWFNHGTNPSGSKSKYKYAVQVDAEPVGGQAKDTIVPENAYTVLKQSRKTHVVKFPAVPGKRGTVYGYVVFPINPSSAVTFGDEGPLVSALHQSLIMAEEKTNPAKLYMSVSSPQLNFQKNPDSPSWCPQNGNVRPTAKGDVDETLLFCAKSTDHDVHLNLRDPAKWKKLSYIKVGNSYYYHYYHIGYPSHYVSPTDPISQNPLKFTNLRNGVDTEVEFNDTWDKVKEK